MKYCAIWFLLIIGITAHAQLKSDSSWSIGNLEEINSVRDDYLPFLSDNTLMFTSDRRNSQESQTTQYSEKVYYSQKQEGSWLKPRKESYKFNSDNNTALIGITPTHFYFYRSYWKDNGEIFSANRTTEIKGSSLKKLNLCTEYDEQSISVINDTSYFSSNRNGTYDIFMQIGTHKPTALNTINSEEYDERDIFISFDGNLMFFSSNRTGKGGYDIYQSGKNDTGWSAPVIMDYPVNTESDDIDFRWYNDTTMFLASNREGGKGGYDIYGLKYIEPILIDTLAEIVITAVLTPPVDSLYENLGVPDFFGMIQIGAYKHIKSVERFKKEFPCISSQKIIMEIEKSDSVTLYKFLINHRYTDLDSAVTKQMELIKMNCLPNKDYIDTPFIVLFDKENNRYAIFWEKDSYMKKDIFHIYRNGKPVWKGKRF